MRSDVRSIRWPGARGLAGALLGLAALGPPAQGQEEGSLAEALGALDAGDSAAWAGAFEELVGARGEAAGLALEGFASRAVVARRARALLLAELGVPEAIGGVLDLLSDEDPDVRASLARSLGHPGLGSERGADRVHALLLLAERDPARPVRRAAVAALGRSGLPEAVGALDLLLEWTRGTDASQVARVLTELPAGRQRVVARVQRAFRQQTSEDSSVLAVLLDGYGRALAELPGGGESTQDRMPFVLGRQHASEEVVVAARTALQELVSRLVEFGELDRADRLLGELGAEGFEPFEVLYRRASLALGARGDAGRARELGEALDRSAALAPPEVAGRWRFFGLHLQGAALFAEGRFEEAGERFRQAGSLMRHLVRQRSDLQPGVLPGRFARRGGTIHVDRLHFVALEATWEALCLLAQGEEPGDAEVLERLRRAHSTLIEAHAAAFLALPETPTSQSWDPILEHPLSPRALVLGNSNLEEWRDGRGLELWGSFGRALATVAPWELPGFEPATGPTRWLVDPLFDPRRRERLLALREAHATRLWRSQLDLRERSEYRGEVGRARGLVLELQQRELMRRREQEESRWNAVPDRDALTSDELLDIFHDLAAYRLPSLSALNLATHLRVTGRTTEARALAERLLADVHETLPGADSVWAEWASARVELLISSTYMDEGRAREAEEASLAAVRRLEALESTVEGARGMGASAEEKAQTEGSLRVARAMRANALISLAVNANVRLGDQERALEYFERAYALDQSDFMVVLLACYRARSGREAEARAVLASVRPSPPLFYNLACTYALLGDTDEALDYLTRDFSENYPTPGALERQKSWAREDPDLAALRGDTRFERLTSE